MATSKSITSSDLRLKFSYDPTTGLFTYINARECRLQGTTAGHLNEEGYVAFTVNRKKYRAHRLAWLYVYGEWPKNYIDHINGIKTDNRIANLRDVSPSQNQQNRHGAESTTTSGLIGVSKSSNKWIAQITASNNAPMRLGTFNSKNEAYEAYLNAKALVHPDSFMAQGVTINYSKFTETALRNLMAGGFLPS